MLRAGGDHAGRDTERKQSASGLEVLVMDDRILSKIVDFLVVVWTSMIALTGGLVAHYLFDASVQTSASIAAAIFALLVAMVWFLQKSN